MLLSDYDYDTDIEVRCEEAGRIAFAEGIERGIEQGIEQGFSEGSYQTKRETAVAFKRLGIDIAKIAEGTGLSVEEIEKL